MYGVRVKLTGRGSFCPAGFKTVPLSRTPSRIGILNPQMRSVPAGAFSFAGRDDCCACVADCVCTDAFGTGWARLDHTSAANMGKQRFFIGFPAEQSNARVGHPGVGPEMPFAEARRHF